ncbi:MAG TPA: phosphoribosylformylglycinamidine synthase subunit PurL [Pseudothermotoga sp.]
MHSYKELGLSEKEYKKIVEILQREPNEIELGMFSVMWSEHCSYKHTKTLLKRFPTTGKRVIQGPGENAGVVDIGDDLVVVFKMESHNHPSAVEPFQGAATGIGGIVRDIFAMGARPITLLDSLRFGDLKDQKTKYLFSGVISGIAHYGNCIGVPTVAGEIYFNDCYDDNPLVNVMCVGIARKKEIKFSKATESGSFVMLVGSSTGRDGIHGASFASENLTEQSEKKRPSVQIGDPFTEKLLIEACLEASKLDCVLAIQDLGAAGLTSACSEVASKGNKGIEIELSLVPQREEGMTPYEIVLSESQERMLLIIKPGSEQIVKEIFEKWDLHAQIIGKITDDGLFTVKMKDRVVAQIPVKALTDEVPIVDLEAIPWINSYKVDFMQAEDLQKVFFELLGSENICSRRFVYERYDHRVGTNTVVLPGSDAAVLRIKDLNKAIAVTTDCNSFYCYLDPYEGAKIAVCEAARNLVVTGAEPVGITDCLNFANPDDPKIAHQLQRAVQGITDAAKYLEIPVVSGNVSLYNESPQRKIYPTPVIGMVGLIEDLSSLCTADFKNPGDVVILLGNNCSEEFACEYTRFIFKIESGKPPCVDLEMEKRLQKTCLRLIREKIINSAHDLSEGGLAIALAESCILGNLGVSCELKTNKRPDFVLFGEDQSRILISVSKEKISSFWEIVQQEDLPVTVIGEVIKQDFIIKINDNRVINTTVNEIQSIYNHSLEKLVNQ